MAGLGGRDGGGGGAMFRGGGAGWYGWFCASTIRSAGGSFAPGMGVPLQSASSGSDRMSDRIDPNRGRRRARGIRRTMAASFLADGNDISLVKDARLGGALKCGK